MKFKKLGQTFSSWLFWSVVSAAFIGPGTVTTAAKAGASYGTSLIWALAFSTLATLILQEAAARIPLATGLNLGEAITKQFGEKRSLGVRLSLAGAVIFGCVAYQTGNILGAVKGLEMIIPLDGRWMSIPLGLAAALLLWQGKLGLISRSLGIIVAAMGLLFLAAAFQSSPEWVAPSTPAGSELLVVALMGTTIVPYNLFLGSGLSKGQTIQQMREGLAGAVLAGGIISVVILLVGTEVEGNFSFEGLSQALENRMGQGGPVLLALGLFAAGFTSAVTAPLASAVTASSLLGKEDQRWKPSGSAFRFTWASVLVVGIIFSLLAIQPIPAIILAQALNGFLLPLVVVFLYRIVNDQILMPKEYRNPPWLNGATLLVLFVSVFLGGLNLVKAWQKATGGETQENFPLIGLLLVSALTTLSVAWITHYRSAKA